MRWDKVVVAQLVPVQRPQLPFDVRMQFQIQWLHLCPQLLHVFHKPLRLKLVPPHLSVVAKACNTTSRQSETEGTFPIHFVFIIIIVVTNTVVAEQDQTLAIASSDCIHFTFS
jgi:hypothetical protein